MTLLKASIIELENTTSFCAIMCLAGYTKEFIKLASLPENKKYTMISLAYDCGFSTKSTFNKHFKVNTGKTPTDFFSTQSN